MIFFCVLQLIIGACSIDGISSLVEVQIKHAAKIAAKGQLTERKESQPQNFYKSSFYIFYYI